MENNIDFGGFIQVAIIVEDIEKAAQKWAQLFNVPVPEIRLLPAGEDKGLRYRGEPANYALKLAVIQANGWIVELHEPDENPSTFREFLNKHGNGVHHLGFCVGEKRDGVIAELEQMGYAMRTVGSNNSWTIVDSEDDLGVNLNIKPKP